MTYTQFKQNRGIIGSVLRKMTYAQFKKIEASWALAYAQFKENTSISGSYHKQ
jgi:hypothetical protein